MELGVVKEKPLIDLHKSHHGPSKQNEPLSITVRLQRNQAEKQRRDKLNGYISELATLVPTVKNATKPVDKVSVLRLAAAHMRLNFSCLNPKYFKTRVPKLPPSSLSQLELIEKCIDGFVVATTFSGIILFCSTRIEDFLGYQPMDLVGHSIYSYVQEKELSFFERKLTTIINHYKKGLSKKSSKMLKLHLMQRPLPRSSEIRYEKMKFKISVHINEDPDTKTCDGLKSPSNNKKIAKCKDFGTSAILLMFVEPTRLETKLNLSYFLTHQDIYFTVHGLQGEIVHADHRISIITGYLPQDVQGKSAYEFIVDSDVPIALFAQKAMLMSNDGAGSITYRLKIYDSKIIYLQSQGQILYKGSSKEICNFVCHNKWLSDEEGSKELKKFQERFIPQIPDLKPPELKNKKDDCLTVKSATAPSADRTMQNSLNETNYFSDQTNENHCKDFHITDDFEVQGSEKNFSHCQVPYSNTSGEESLSPQDSDESFENNSFMTPSTNTFVTSHIDNYINQSQMNNSIQNEGYDISHSPLFMNNQSSLFHPTLMPNDDNLNLAQFNYNQTLLETGECGMDVDSSTQKEEILSRNHEDFVQSFLFKSSQESQFSGNTSQHSQMLPLRAQYVSCHDIHPEDLNIKTSSEKILSSNKKQNSFLNGLMSSDFSSLQGSTVFENSNCVSYPTRQDSYSSFNEMPKNNLFSEKNSSMTGCRENHLNRSCETMPVISLDICTEYGVCNPNSTKACLQKGLSFNHVNNFNNDEIMYSLQNGAYLGVTSPEVSSYKVRDDLNASIGESMSMDSSGMSDGDEQTFHLNHCTNRSPKYTELDSSYNVGAANLTSTYDVPSKRKRVETLACKGQESSSSVVNTEQNVNQTLFSELDMFLTKLCPITPCSQNNSFGSTQPTMVETIFEHVFK